MGDGLIQQQHSREDGLVPSGFGKDAGPGGRPSGPSGGFVRGAALKPVGLILTRHVEETFTIGKADEAIVGLTAWQLEFLRGLVAGSGNSADERVEATRQLLGAAAIQNIRVRVLRIVAAGEGVSRRLVRLGIDAPRSLRVSRPDDIQARTSEESSSLAQCEAAEPSHA